MNLDQNVFNLAYQLLQPNVGQKYLKEIIENKVRVKKCPEFFKENLEKEKIQIIPFWDKEYPFLLKQISDFPVFLFVKGDVSLLTKKSVTVVGSRKISEYSLEVLEKFFSKRKDFLKDICFTSGLAYGVDSEVHRLCLKKNLPTIGVIGGGLDRVYYRGDSIMYQHLCKYRLVISEFPPGRKFFKGMFPLRNRILAGMSERTFVIQAGERSGALNTASHANNYGREVFAIPSDIFLDSHQGCLKLISEGAGIIKNIDDFVGYI